MSAPHPDYTGEAASCPGDFQQYCEEVLALFGSSDCTLRASRNTLKKLELDGKQYVLKAFKVPTFPQNIIYGIASDSKAKKSFQNGSKLIEKGFHTPLPEAYFEHRAGGKLLRSYYLCAHLEAETMVEFTQEAENITDELISSFAQLCADLHERGVLHRDFNPLNILVDKEASNYRFSLVDINRISWYNKLTLPQAMQSMSRLYFPGDMERKVLEKYATIRGIPLEECNSALKKEKQKTLRYFRNKEKLRKIFPRK